MIETEPRKARTAGRKPPAPRIFRVNLRRADGKRRWSLVKCTFYERNPKDSLFGLQARLAEMTIEGTITASAVLVPANVTPQQRAKLTRWPEALDRMTT